MEKNQIRTRKLFVFIMIDFIKSYYKYGCKLYPCLFRISLFLCSLNFINIFTGRFNEWNCIALCCYFLFFGGILISFLLNKKNYYDYIIR